MTSKDINHALSNIVAVLDGIVFIIISFIVVAYFSTFSYKTTIWLVPIILFGLGYRLLLRVIGVKIRKPLSIFQRHSK